MCALITDPGAAVNFDDAEAADINARFNTLFTELNGRLSDPNISSTAAIAETKLALQFNTTDLQTRIGVGANKWSGRKSISVIRANDISTIAISLPIISSIITPAASGRGLEYAPSLGNLWYTDDGTAEVYRLNTSTGAVLSSFDVTGFGPRDIAWDLTNLWVVGDTTNEVYRMNTLGTILSSFDTPSTSPRGLTYLNNYLYLSDATSDQIYRLNTLGTALVQFATPAANPEGLSNNGIDLFCGDTNDIIYKLNTAGTILASFTHPLNIELGAASADIRALAWDESHLWIVNDTPDLLLKCLWAGFQRAPVVSLSQSTGGSISGYALLFTNREILTWANHQYTALTAITSFEIPNSAAHGIAFERGANRTTEDYYMLNGGTRVLRYRRGTFQSSFSLSGVTSLTDIVMGDNYMWLIDDAIAPDNFIYQINSTVYDVDSLTRVALASFNWDAVAGFSDTTVGLGYDDETPTQHALWICETAARTCARVSTAAGTIYSDRKSVV